MISPAVIRIAAASAVSASISRAITSVAGAIPLKRDVPGTVTNDTGDAPAASRSSPRLPAFDGWLALR